MAEDKRKTPLPIPEGSGGLIGAIHRATLGLALMLEATQQWADETEARMRSVTESAREAQKAAQDAIGASQTMAPTDPSSARTGPAGRTQAVDVIEAVASHLVQQAGRRTG